MHLDNNAFSSDERVYEDKLTKVLQFDEVDEIAVGLNFNEWNFLM